jgi:hypothetical protein
MTASKDSGYTSQCLLGVWKDGEMVEVATTKPTMDYRPEKMLSERIDTIPEMIKTIVVREFDFLQLDRLENLISDYPNLKIIDLNFKYNDEVMDNGSSTGRLLKTDFLSKFQSIERVIFKGDIHSPEIKSIDFAGISTLPILVSLYIYETTNLRWLEFNPLSCSHTIEKIVVNSHAVQPMRIRRLKLSGLNECRSLKEIIISGPCLDELDLSPLDGSKSLMTLTIMDVNTHVDEDWNDYLSKVSTKIDVTPVNSEDKMLDLKIPRCENLKTILIYENSRVNVAVKPTTSKFKSIDLTNLEHAEHFRRLKIQGQGLYQLDLSPLFNLQELQFIQITDNDNLAELDISPILPMAERLRQCRFQKYITTMVFDEEKQRSVDVHGPPIRYRASRNMDIFYDEFKPKFTAFKEEGDSIVDDPIDIEWY